MFKATTVATVAVNAITNKLAPLFAVAKPVKRITLPTRTASVNQLPVVRVIVYVPPTDAIVVLPKADGVAAVQLRAKAEAKKSA